MAELIKILTIGLVGTFAFVILKQAKPEMAIFVICTSSILIILVVINLFGSALTSVLGLVSSAGISGDLIKTILKIVGVGYVIDFASSVADDSGAGSIADKISFGGKIIILIIALPVFKNIFDVIVEIVNI